MKQRHESWHDEDDEFENHSSPLRLPWSSFDNRQHKSGIRSSDSEDDDLEFDREEDQTVTVYTRRIALCRPNLRARQGTHLSPVPALAPSLTPPLLQRKHPTLAHLFRLFSPNYCLSTSFSTNHNLLDVSSPTLSCSSPGLGGLPPRSPIHRERERRRLRKKSPPPGIGGNVIKAGLLARARNNEELERTREDDAFGHGDRNEDEDHDDVLIHSMPPPASHHHQSAP
jgi:hypothetical protein